MTLKTKPTNSNSMWSNSFLIFLIKFFPTLATLLVIIGFSRELPQEVYGTYQSFWVQLYLLSAVALVGIPAIVLTYSPSFIKQLIQTLRAKHYLLLSVWLLVVAFVFSYLSSKAIGIAWYIPFLFFIVYSCNAIAEAILIVYRRFSILLFINIGYAIVFLLLHLDMLNGTMTMPQLYGYLLALGGTRLLVTATKSLSHTQKIIGQQDNRYTVADIRSLWLHIGIYEVFQKTITWVDKFVIVLLFSSGVSAVYFNATYDIPFLPLIIGAVSGAALMQMATFKNNTSDASTIQVSHQTGRILSCIAFPLFFFLYLYRQELFTVVLTSKYAESIPIFAAAVWMVPLRAYSFTSILQNKHKGRIINTGALIDYIVACLLMYPLYKLMGLPGIALSFVLSTYVQSAYYVQKTAKILNTSMLRLLPVKNWIVKFLVFAIAFIAIHYITARFFTAGFVLISGILSMILLVAVSVWVEIRFLKKEYGNKTA